MNRYANEVDPHERASNFEPILTEQISRYPLLQIQDLYKLIHQAAMGSEHAVEDREAARAWLEQELENLRVGHPEPLIDPISPSGEIVRVNLRPYLSVEGDPDSLLDAFVRTANKYQGSVEQLGRYWTYTRRMVEEGKLPFELEKMDAFFFEMESEGFPAVHHSPEYEAAYQPAYRVVAAIYVPELLGR